MNDDLVRWILQNCPVIVYPEDRGHIERDMQRWRQRIWYIAVRLRWN